MQLNLLVIRSNQPKALADFYQLLGMEFENHQHGKGPWHYSSQIGATVFEIYPLLKNQESPDRSLRLGFSVDKLDQLLAKLKEKDVEIIQEARPSEWGYFALIKDLDGRKIELKNKE